MPTEKEIYLSHADKYDLLIQREDYQGNILHAIEDITPLHNMDVIDLGAGTGRLTRLLAPRVKSIHAFDTSAHMLETASNSLRALGLNNWRMDVADHRQLPVESASADVGISGWSFSYLSVWGGENSRAQLQAGLAEAKRVLRPNGILILIESLGTGNTSPIKLIHLEDYYAWLAENNFKMNWIRTDYKFESKEEADALAKFFFGEEIKVENNILPECTGLWRLKK
jgi:ubiquinone/menaquinone biosynthesis C-methylase UbiE